MQNNQMEDVFEVHNVDPNMDEQKKNIANSPVVLLSYWKCFPLSIPAIIYYLACTVCGYIFSHFANLYEDEKVMLMFLGTSGIIALFPFAIFLIVKKSNIVLVICQITASCLSALICITFLMFEIKWQYYNLEWIIRAIIKPKEIANMWYSVCVLSVFFLAIITYKSFGAIRNLRRKDVTFISL